MMRNQTENVFPIVIFGSTHSQRRSALRAVIDAGHRPILPSCGGDMPSFTEEFSGQLFHSLALPPRPMDIMLEKAAEFLTGRFGDRWTTFGTDDQACEFSAALSSGGGIATFPRQAALSILHQNRLRKQWNEIAVGNEKYLRPVEHALLSFDSAESSPEEIRKEMKSFSGWENENTIKPNVLNSAIEAHRAGTFSKSLESIESILSTLHQAHEQRRIDEGVSKAQEILIEEAIPRRQEPAEYGVEVLSIHGKHTILGVTEKCVDPKTHLEIGHTFPAPSFPDFLYSHLVTALTELLRGLEVANCFSHWAFIVTPDERIALAEGQLHPGGRIGTLYRLATGRDPYHEFFEGVVRGSDLTSGPPPSRFAAIRALAPEHPLQHVEEIVQTASAAEDERLLIVDKAIIELEQWMGPVPGRRNFAEASATGETKGTAEARCSALAMSVELRGLDHGGNRRESRLVVFGS